MSEKKRAVSAARPGRNLRNSSNFALSQQSSKVFGGVAKQQTSFIANQRQNRNMAKMMSGDKSDIHRIAAEKRQTKNQRSLSSIPGEGLLFNQ